MAQRAATRLADLVDAGWLAPDDAPALRPVEDSFRIRVTPAMLGAMTAADDPVARQFLPTRDELVINPGELADPIGDVTHSPVPGLTHRYPDRVILHVTKTCEVYCRFCFRREAVGEDGPMTDAQLDAACAYLNDHSEISEVILTGGDPLILSPRRLGGIMARLAAIPHLSVVRLHTRIPVVAPERITDDLVAALDTRLAPYVVIHTNHAQEITPAAGAALRKLARAGVPLLSQTVLLRGINNDAETLARLFRTLLQHRVTPYYLHHCDLARGAGHFRTTIHEGQAIMAKLRGRLTGIALPTYVLDIPGGAGKVPIGPGYAHETVPGQWRITDWRGGVHDYTDPDAPSPAR